MTQAELARPVHVHARRAHHENALHRGLAPRAALLLAGALLAALLASADAYAAERMVAPKEPNAKDAGGGPYKTLSYAMSQLQPGDHLVIAAGTYRDVIVFPKRTWSVGEGVETVVEGRGEVIVKGSEVVDGWKAVNDGLFVKEWPAETQQVFVDGKLLKQVGGTIFNGYPDKPDHALAGLHKTQKGIWPGRTSGNQDNMPNDSFYYDRDAKQLYIRVPMQTLKGHTVEVSTKGHLMLGSGVSNVTVKNINFMHNTASTTMRAGAVTMIGNHITLEDIHVSESDSTGIDLIGDDIVMRRSSANDCGQIGLKARGKRIQLINNVTNGNNTRGFNKWWEAGGAKFVGDGGLQDSLVSGHTALSNNGDGIWYDWKNRNNTLENGFFAYNKGMGIHYEASDRGRIVNNVSIGNDQRGIYLPHSSSTIIAFNLVAGNRMQGIAIINEGRSDPDKEFDFSARGNKVFGNVLAWNPGPLVLPTDIADNQSDGNVYIGDATQSNPGQGWVGMFQEALQKWTSRTQQDANSLRLENAIDPGFAKSIAERSPDPDLSWYRALRSKTKPVNVSEAWLKLVPNISDRRPGATLSKIPALSEGQPAEDNADAADKPDAKQAEQKPAQKPPEPKPQEPKQPEQKQPKQPDDQNKP